MSQPPLLRVERLGVAFQHPREAPVEAVRSVSWSIERGETLALVGESGSGKSVSAQSILGLLPRNARVTGSIRWNDQELVGAKSRVFRQLRGNRVSLVPQDPMASLNPVYTIGQQLAEGIRAHQRLTSAEIAARSLELLEEMRIPRAAERLRSYPHELSGGQRQRVVIAMALANRPDLIIADEATTALDVTVQAQVMDSLRRARELTGAALLLITHDLGVVAGMADRVAVMRQGEIMETGPVDTIFHAPASPYTRRLLDSVPRLRDVPDLSGPAEVGEHEEANPFEEDPLIGTPGRPLPVLSMRGVRKEFVIHEGGLFRRRMGVLRAVGGVDLDLWSGETLGIVGESGSGKTTLIRTIFNLEPITGGRIIFGGRDMATMSQIELRRLRSRMQMVFQDPGASLDPMMTVRESMLEPAIINGIPRREAVQRMEALLDRVHLRPEHAGRYPNEFSGGQRQRIAIARALMLSPQILVLDEPVSSLDVSIQAEVLKLLRELQRDLGLSYLFVSHDLSVVAEIAHKVVVMYHGRIVERGAVRELFGNPRHPYTRALISAVPVPDPAIERHRKRQVFSGTATNIVMDADRPRATPG